MPLNEATYEQLERWLRGELAADELAAFEARLASEPELLEEAEWLTNAQEVMNDEGRAAFKKMLAEIGAGVGAAALATYTPTRNAIPKWKMWLKKFWWIPVATLAAVSAIAFALTAVEVTRDDHPPLIPDEMLKEPEMKTDSVKEEYNAPAVPEKDSVKNEPETKSSTAGVTKPKPTARSGDANPSGLNNFVYAQELPIVVDQKYQSLINSLIVDSAYTVEQIMKTLKRRKIDFTKQSSPAGK